MATPAKYDINLVAGDDWQITVRLINPDSESTDGYIDTSSFAWAAQIRTAPLPSGQLVETISADPVTGGVTLSLTSAQTRSFATRRGLVWDLQASSPDVRTWLSGSVQVTPEVTE